MGQDPKEKVQGETRGWLNIVVCWNPIPELLLLCSYVFTFLYLFLFCILIEPHY
jgi:hypothetical protein